MFSRPSLFLSLGLAHSLCSSSGSFQSSLSSVVSHNPSENYICFPTRPTPWAEKNKVSMIDTLKVSSDFDPCGMEEKRPAFASLFNNFLLTQGSGKLFVTPRMALFTITLFYTGLNQELNYPLSMFSCHIMYLQAVWGGVLTSSIGFTKRCHSSWLARLISI